MAEAVIGGIAEKIIEILGSQAIKTVGKLWGIKRELEALKKIVSPLQLVLDDAEEQYHRPHIRIWVEQLKDAFYEAQDLLEEFNIEAMRRELRGHNEMMKAVRTFFSSSNQLAFKLKMSDKIREVRARIEAIKADKEVHLNERPEREWRKREEMHSFIREGDIIGREDDKKTIMEFLLDSDMQENVSILPIVGIGGLGKTALAQSVYNDEMVSKQFNLKMWVCVSDDFDTKKIVKNIIACAKKKKEPIEGAMEQLQSELRGAIDGKRYLLILDDLWNTELETWLNLKTLLVGGAKGSKILITTRLPLVVKITGTTLPHHLGSLSESTSLELLMQIACCKEEEKQDPDMLAIGKDIVRKCSRVPLAIRTIGSLLFKKSKHEWLQFKEKELPDVSIMEDGIMPILKLSYYHLPSHLKQCFAFCSLFPKDYEIKKQTLVDLWIAEGFIKQSNRPHHLEDIACGYFKDLLLSNFFQDYQENKETCKMHDLMHDLACSVAGTECWVAWDDTKPIHERARHISHDSTSNFMGKLPISRLKASTLRTILLFTRDWGREPTSEADLHRLIQSFKTLRILDMNNKYFDNVPRSIGKLKYLTYLDLSGNRALKSLPNSITRLQNLQTLNLNNCSSLKELPKGIRKLVSLRNLDIEGCLTLSYMPRGLGQLSLLHRLSDFILPKDKALAKKYGGLGELYRLNNIRGSLFIKNLGSVTDAGKESHAANLIEKRFLEILALSWGNFDITDEAIIKKRDEALLDGLRPPKNLQELRVWGFKGERIPGWLTDLPNLVALRLWSCTGCRHFPQVGLNKLKELRMVDMRSLEYIPEECLKSLTSLESLYFNYLPRLTSLLPGLRHLSKLVDLTILGCEELDLSKDESGNIILDFHGLQSLRSLNILHLPKLESLPQWILQLRSLEHLGIYCCDNLKALSEQIEALQSLQWLEIEFCRSLTSLPEGMRRLTSLTHLTIYSCPELRCKRDEGEDWYKIKHIPEISI
ncbi:disease resistance protein RGA2-like [Eucalyptus grandis]|uniref:disease resistance protein RGA2-like n=1 Tax=Eucalyptus grandis TaxID=71139 RepID=UPI00192F0E53|nr:disease resistance protein RGA2-like [Eucalyptus grandis]